MAKRNGKFIGAYVDRNTKRKLKDEAKRLDRPVAWVIEKILEQGVKHLAEQSQPEPKAMAA